MTVLYEIQVPKDGIDEEILVINLYFSSQDPIQKEVAIIDLETSKTVLELSSTVDGYIEYLVENDEIVQIGQTIARIHDSISSIQESISHQDETKKEKPSNKKNIGKTDKLVAKDAQLLVDNHNVDISLIDSSFIKKKDVEKYLKEQSITVNSDKNKKLSTLSKPISNSKKIEIENLLSVNKTGLVSTVFINVKAVDLSNSTENSLSSSSYLPLILLETSKLLKKYSSFNSFFANQEIHEYQDINIGLAIDIDDGLKVFTLYETDKKSLAQIKDLLSQGIYKYLRKSLTPKELTGSTFTVTDLSLYGVDRFIPLVNKNQSSILAISSMDETLKRFNLSLSFDHRVIEGKRASEFLFELKELIENYIS